MGLIGAKKKENNWLIKGLKGKRRDRVFSGNKKCLQVRIGLKASGPKANFLREGRKERDGKLVTEEGEVKLITAKARIARKPE